MTALSLKISSTAHQLATSDTVTYSLRGEGYRYSMGYVKNVRGEEEWTSYCVGRRDIGFEMETTVHPNRAAAMSAIRAAYDAAEARYAEFHALIVGILNSAEGLSTIAPYGSWQHDEEITMKIIDTQNEYPTMRLVLTVQEALTALDYLYERSDRRFVTYDIGRVVNGEADRPAYVAWKVPYGHSDYTLAGWTSTSGEGRRQTNAFNKAIYDYQCGKTVRAA